MAAPSVILALDQGSSSTRCIAYDARLEQVATAVSRVETSRPGPGMVEHDPDALLAGALAAIAETRAACDGEVAAIGIANQTETFVLWERETGRAVTRVALSELPPSSKKDSSTPTRSVPSTSANTAATASSTGVRGAR